MHEFQRLAYTLKLGRHLSDSPSGAYWVWEPCMLMISRLKASDNPTDIVFANQYTPQKGFLGGALGRLHELNSRKALPAPRYRLRLPPTVSHCPSPIVPYSFSNVSYCPLQHCPYCLLPCPTALLLPAAFLPRPYCKFGCLSSPLEGALRFFTRSPNGEN